MDRYFTVMVVPEREKGVRTFRIPRIVFQAMTFLGVTFLILLGVFSYDYFKILTQLTENKHLTIENRQLKEQIQLFQMKINSLTDDLERINTFERKLRIITGLQEKDMTQKIGPGNPDVEEEKKVPTGKEKSTVRNAQDIYLNLDEFMNIDSNPRYVELKKLYEQKIATSFGLYTGFNYTKEWSKLTKQSFELAGQLAEFDFKFSTIKDFVKKLEINIHQLDQFLLDKESFLKSTPTLLPTKGWITSYYGPRISPTSKRLRMHEGLDIGAKPGTPIVAPADGKVIYAGVKPGFGKFVQLDHGYGIETFYAHAKRLHVKKGEILERGKLIARIGNTGSSTGPHLHYEIRVNGTPVDPLYYVLD